MKRAVPRSLCCCFPTPALPPAPSMDRPFPPPLRPALRVLVLCLVMALAFLWSAGGTPGESLSLVAAMLPLDSGGPGALRELLGRILSSFLLISLALVMGLSVAFALAMFVVRRAGRIVGRAGWLEGVLTAIPPMAWALGAMVFFIRVCELPVETLFPYPPPPALDNLSLRIGRRSWAWLVPALTLAAPVLAMVFFSLTHRLRSMLDGPELNRLRARGLRPSQILHRHLSSRLRVELAALARPAAAMLLAFDIPVEELLGFDGWGRLVAAQLLAPDTSERALAVLLWTGGVILAGVLGWIGLLDRRGPLAGSSVDFPLAQDRSVAAAVFGGLLALVLVLGPIWLARGGEWRALAESHRLWAFELGRAFVVAGAALALMVALDFLMSLGRWRIPGRRWVHAFSLAPLLVAILLWERANGRQWWVVAVGTAFARLGWFRQALFGGPVGDGCLEAARALGQGKAGVWRRHLLPGLMPMLPRLMFRFSAAALMMWAVLDFYSPDTRTTWGRLLRLGADRVLDEPAAVLAPAAWIALWSLSFRLLGRAFPSEVPLIPPPRSDR